MQIDRPGVDRLGGGRGEGGNYAAPGAEIVAI